MTLCIDPVLFGLAFADRGRISHGYPAVAVVVLDQEYQLGKCCWSEPRLADEQPVEPQQARQRKQRQGQH